MAPLRRQRCDQQAHLFYPHSGARRRQAWLLTEFGGYALKTPGHTWNERTFGYRVYPNKEKLTAAYQKLFNKVIIPQIKTGLAATVYTQVTDVEDEING